MKPSLEASAPAERRGDKTILTAEVFPDKLVLKFTDGTGVELHVKQYHTWGVDVKLPEKWFTHNETAP